MSAPPGWHPQPDGRDRWWDGRQWTDHYRDAAAPPAPPVPTGYDQYGRPGQDPQGGWQQPQRQGMSKGLKGCLVAGVVLLVLLVAGAVAAVFFVGRSIENAVENTRPSGGLPSVGDVVVTVRVGEGFDVRGAEVEDGWSVEGGGIGSEVSGMRATFDDSSRTTPTVFTMRFTGADGGTVDTVCTAEPAGGDTPTDVRCVPLFGDVDESGEVQVVPTF